MVNHKLRKCLKQRYRKIKHHYNFKKTLAYNNRALSIIRAKVAINQEWLRLINSGLTDDLASHIVACVIKNDNMLVYVESAAWAHRLRFYSDCILSNINKSSQVTVKKLLVKITIISLRQPKQKRHLKKPLPDTITGIAQSAQGTNDDLQRALLNLIKTLRNRR